jgi:hypothetical protein
MRLPKKALFAPKKAITGPYLTLFFALYDTISPS